MHILAVDDLPEFKIKVALKDLKEFGLHFNLFIAYSINSAIKYIMTNSKTIDLIILDLGLPIMDDGFEISELNGLMILRFLTMKQIHIPVVINSTTHIPDEDKILASYTDNGFNVCHVENLNGKWLYSHIQKLICSN